MTKRKQPQGNQRLRVRKTTERDKAWMDFTPSGYNFCGPGNAMGGQGTNAVDELCQQHDEGYQRIQEQGGNPYLYHNSADEDFLHGLNQLPHNRRTAVGHVARGYFSAKRMVAPAQAPEHDKPTPAPAQPTNPPTPAPAQPTRDPDDTKPERKTTDGERSKWANYQKPSLPEVYWTASQRNEFEAYTSYTRRKDWDDKFYEQALKEWNDRNAPVSNLPTQDNMPRLPDGTPAPTPGAEVASLQAAGGGMNHGRETPVDPVAKIYKTIPWDETANTILPYVYYQPFNAPTLAQSTPVGLRFRLNSPYDCMVASNLSTWTPDDDIADLATGTPVIESTQWWNYWSKIYRHWTVVGSRYRIKLFHLTAQTGTDNQAEYSMWVYHHSNTNPPIFQRNADNTGDIRVPDRVRKWHRNGKLTQFRPNHSVNDRSSDPVGYTTGSFAPGQIEGEVTDTQEDEVWVKVGGVPKLGQYCTIFLQPSDDWDARKNLLAVNETLAPTKFMIKIEVEYLVQWKDLASTYEFVTENSGYPAISNYLNQTTIQNL